MPSYKRIIIKRKQRSAREKKLIKRAKQMTKRQRHAVELLLKERRPIWMKGYSPETMRVLVRKGLVELVKSRGYSRGYRLSAAGREYMYLTHPWLFALGRPG